MLREVAYMIPNPIAALLRATSDPRISGGATSALYIGTSMLFAPTPTPVHLNQ